ncbi:MAG: Uncharacterised protein [Methanobacteriota archaeon]|nr:MAG: Uncharacterised protein [Euryarchaeota archaeon]|tara:strand:- start:2 stop:658 length:657 start_codon:yes stop_codon:yes gene_type:complete
MQQMGFTICCLLCDAPDQEGSSRCKGCISTHKRVRERLSKTAENTVDQFAKDLMILTSEPERHDHDPVHGPFLKEAVRLLSAHRGQRPPPTEEEVMKAFELARISSRESNLRKTEVDLAESDEDILQDAIELVESGSTKDYDTGQRTRPSRPIPTVDRTERLGEDRELMDRFRAEEQVRRTGEEASEGIIEELIDKRKKKRSELADELSDLDDLIDSD